VGGVEIIRGHVLATLPTLAEASVQTVVTSPPYWGLRDYGTDPVAWPTVRFPMMPGVPYEAVVPAMDASLGLEQTHVAYVGHLVAVFRAVERVLRKDGTLWLNLGDAFTSGGRTWRAPDKKDSKGGRASDSRAATPAGYKPKDLLPLPWLVAFALQADGWYLRSWMPWVKRNPMPGSQRDRPTASCETVFLFAHPKSKGRYTYDHEAVKQPASPVSVARRGRKDLREKPGRDQAYFDNAPKGLSRQGIEPKHAARTWRTADAFFGSMQAILDGGQGMLANDEGDPLALVVNTKGYKGAHFAVFPPHLVEPCILAGAPEGATVLDPFGGAGSTGLAASKLGRHAVLCELSDDYADQAEARVPQ